MLTPGQLRLLATILERGAENASLALSQWLGRHTRLSISEVDEVDLSDAAGVLGPEDAMIAACSMRLSSGLSGQLLLVFEDRSGLALTEFLLHREVGSITEWNELERSAAMETANIVGCAFLNSLSSHLPGLPQDDTLTPSPPTFFHEFSGSLLEFALMDQAAHSDRVLMIRSRFEVEGEALSWNLLLIPDSSSLANLPSVLSGPISS